MATLITDQDLAHMKAFPAGQKINLMQKIMVQLPVAERNFHGNTGCVKTILKLRADGLRLIDLQPLETAFTSIWYRRGGSLLESLRGRAKSEIAAMVLWECHGDDGDMTTVRMWHI